MVPILWKFCPLLWQLVLHVGWFGLGFKTSCQKSSLILPEVNKAIRISDNRGVWRQIRNRFGVEMIMFTRMNGNCDTGAGHLPHVSGPEARTVHEVLALHRPLARLHGLDLPRVLRVDLLHGALLHHPHPLVHGLAAQGQTYLMRIGHPVTRDPESSQQILGMNEATILLHLIWSQHLALDTVLDRTGHHLLVLVHPVLLLGHPEAATLPEPGVPALVLQGRVQVSAHHCNLGLQFTRLEDAHEAGGVPGGSSSQFSLFYQ